MRKKATELYRRHRPTTIDEVVGQPDAVKILRAWFEADKVPHAILLHGPSGTGKTTIARIIARQVKCHRADFKEYNTADMRGIDTVRGIIDRMGNAPFGSGESRCYLIDECHMMTSEAQEASLKMTEEAPDHVYFVFATTNPEKLKPTLRGRLAPVPLKSIDRPTMRTLLLEVAQKEGMAKKPSDALLEKIVEAAGGSAREALVLLGNVIGLKKEEDMLAAIVPPESQRVAFDVVKELIPFKGLPRWDRVRAVLAEGGDADPEGVRQIVMNLARKIMVDPKQQHRCLLAFYVVRAFTDPFHDAKNAASALLVAACYEACGEANQK